MRRAALVVALFACDRGERPVAPTPPSPAPADAAPPRPLTIDVRATGALAVEQAREAVLLHAEMIASCRGAQPRLAFDIDVASDGHVMLVRSLIAGALAEAGECITHVARFWTFPAATGTTQISVTAN